MNSTPCRRPGWRRCPGCPPSRTCSDPGPAHVCSCVQQRSAAEACSSIEQFSAAFWGVHSSAGVPAWGALKGTPSQSQTQSSCRLCTRFRPRKALLIPRFRSCCTRSATKFAAQHARSCPHRAAPRVICWHVSGHAAWQLQGTALACRRGMQVHTHASSAHTRLLLHACTAAKLAAARMAAREGAAAARASCPSCAQGSWRTLQPGSVNPFPPACPHLEVDVPAVCDLLRCVVLPNDEHLLPGAPRAGGLVACHHIWRHAVLCAGAAEEAECARRELHDGPAGEGQLAGLVAAAAIWRRRLVGPPHTSAPHCSVGAATWEVRCVGPRRFALFGTLL
eukprot:352589-Chlamydomonas_euryale.AAC.4